MSYSEPPPPPPPGYGQQQPYGEPLPPPRNSVASIWALVLGILGVVPCMWGCFVFSAIAVVLGVVGKKDVLNSEGRKKGLALAQWGLYLGIAGLVISVLWWILVAADVINFNIYGDVS